MPPHDLTKNLYGNPVQPIADTDYIVADPPAKKEKVIYPFVNLIRFVATIGIVYIHTEFYLTTDESAFFHKVPHIEFYFLFRQIFKFSTICYFLIAGFLLGDKIDSSQRFKYFFRRLKVIVRPFMLAAFIFIMAFIVDKTATQKVTLPYLIETCKYVLCYTPFWYVPNYLVCLLVIICFARYTKELWFGAVLFTVTLLYTYFNVYSNTHTSSHTTALFGFVFYMWLGVYIKKAGLIGKIKSMNIWLPGGLLLLTFILCNCETWYLFYHTHTRDSLNTLRISNQLYSVAVFAFLVRCCGTKPNFGIFKPKQETYGIYLYHSFFIFFIIPAIEGLICRQYHITLLSYNVYQIIGINLLNFVLCYFATTALVKVLIRFKLAYLPY